MNPAIHNPTARIAALDAIKTLDTALDDAADTLRHNANTAHIFPIPVQTEDEEDPPTQGVTELVGPDAIDTAITTLTRTRYTDHQHRMATLRRPGLIVFDADLADLTTHINQHKAHLRATMKTFGRGGWEYWRTRLADFKRLNRLQAYREWRWLDEPVAQFGVSWAGFDHSIVQLRVAALIQKLYHQRARTEHPHILDEVERLQALNPDEVVVIRRPVAPTPLVNVRFVSGQRRAFKAAVPLMAPAPMPTKIGRLTDFNLNERNQPRDDQTIEEMPLVAYFNAYRYLAPYRFGLPADPVPARLHIHEGRIVIQPGPKATPESLGSTDRLLAIIAATDGIHGQLPVDPALDDAHTVRAVATNAVHLYVTAPGPRVWRIPLYDLYAATRMR